ncbi:MAG: cyclodeaminase/cyclohydrolase family protein [Clostridia bacterium]|jgi:formiminotetrahydrofolate cyclodeaminase|nr:cyclodeaminase/cyclohydrolase family protein [Clostridia bacterium]
MSEIFDWPLRKVIEASASDAPTPGGGSVSAMVGCFGVAMISMVGNLTVGKEKYRDVEAQTEKILERTKQLLGRLEELVSADMDAFNNFMKVLRMPKDTEEEKAERARLMQEALKKATDTPLEIARVCLQGLELAHDLSSIGNKGAISDVGVGAYVCEAALNSVLLSVDINVPSIKDTAYVEKVLEEKKQLIAKAQELRAKAVAEVQARM